MMLAKPEIRTRLLRLRRAQALAEAKKASQAIQQAIAGLSAYRAAAEVLLYMPVNGEADTRALLDDLLARKVRVLLPRCEPGQSGRMHLASLNSVSQLVCGSYNIPEPCPDRCAPVDDYAPQVAVIPGVGFSHGGLRLGYGGGYYDRLLAHPAMANTLLVAPAFGFQLLQDLPADPWDKPMHLLATPDGVLNARTASGHASI